MPMRYSITRSFVSFLCVIVCIFGTLIFFNRNEPATIIVNRCEGGRLGDQILSYSKAKWLSYKYSVPFRLIPFNGFKQLHVSKVIFTGRQTLLAQ